MLEAAGRRMKDLGRLSHLVMQGVHPGPASDQACAGPAGPDLPGGPSLDHSHTGTGAKYKLLVLSHGLREWAVTQHYYGDSCDTDEVPEGNNR